MKVSYLLIIILTSLAAGFSNIKKTNVNTVIQVKEQDTTRFLGIVLGNQKEKETMQLTGDADYDFAQMMMIHFAGGIELSFEELKTGNEPVMLNLAIQIKNEQQRDMRVFRKYVADQKPSKKADPAFRLAIKANLDKARLELKKQVILVIDADKNYATLMEMHHRHGIDIIQSEIKYGVNPQLKKLAQEMLDRMQDERLALEEFRDKV
jgi:uncharacterized protein (DUF305 family)